MSRKLSEAQMNVTPIRTLNGSPSLDGYDETTRQTARKTNPYRIGDVLRVEPGVDALVVNTMTRRVIEGDVNSSLLPCCKVRKKTSSGAWSKIWSYAWPGDIERGYGATLAS